MSSMYGPTELAEVSKQGVQTPPDVLNGVAVAYHYDVDAAAEATSVWVGPNLSAM